MSTVHDSVGCSISICLGGVVNTAHLQASGAGRSAALLRDVREFVCKQVLTGYGMRRVGAVAEDDAVACSISLRVDVSSRLRRFCPCVNPNRCKAPPESWLKHCSRRRMQRLADGPEYSMNEAGYANGVHTVCCFALHHIVFAFLFAGIAFGALAAA